MLRIVSMLLRKRRFLKNEKKSLKRFADYLQQQKILPAYTQRQKKLLIIRLDDIGDFLLFRNTLPYYRQSSRWNGYTITLLGNAAWQHFFLRFDTEYADQTIWVNKKEYLRNDEYKFNIWQRLRSEGFEVVICPSATRPILLDDLCRMAAGAPAAYAFTNLTPHLRWATASDTLYNNLYPPTAITHEFFLNQQFANWCCDTDIHLARPSIDDVPAANGGYILCFTGASTISKRWPQKRWEQMILLMKQPYNLPVKVIGGAEDNEQVEKIAVRTQSESITNASLDDVLNLISQANAVLTNDTMAAHLAVSLGKTVVIVANGGNNFKRFTNYREAGINKVVTVYPPFFYSKKSRTAQEPEHHMPSSADIGTITAESVLHALTELL